MTDPKKIAQEVIEKLKKINIDKIEEQKKIDINLEKLKIEIQKASYLMELIEKSKKYNRKNLLIKELKLQIEEIMHISRS